MCVAFLHSAYVSTRYLFFIYPIILSTILLSAKELTQKFVGTRENFKKAQVTAITALLCLGSFAFSKDFNPKHIVQVTTERVGFRKFEYNRFARTWYFRHDYRSPAEFINQNVSEEDAPRIIVVDQPPVSYYLKEEHAVYYSRNGDRFSNVSRERGTVDLWSNNQLLSTKQNLREYTKEITTVWLIRSSSPEMQRFRIEEVWDTRLKSVSRMFLSIDGRIEVVQVKLEKN